MALAISQARPSLANEMFEEHDLMHMKLGRMRSQCRSWMSFDRLKVTSGRFRPVPLSAIRLISLPLSPPFLSFFQSVCLPVCLSSLFVSVCLSPSLSIYLSHSLSLFIWLSIFVFLVTFIFVFCLSISKYLSYISG